MKFPFVSRRRRDAEVAALKERVLATEARHDEVVRAHNRLAKQLAEADAANRRLNGRVEELGRRNSQLTESDPEYAAALEQQLADTRKELAAETKRADRLQRRLDSALGLNDPAVLAGQNWQSTREDVRKGASS